MFSKIEVNGPNAHPVYQFLRKNSELYNEQEKVAGEIPWNFTKFLVDTQGVVRERFDSGVEPLSPKLTGAIDALLKG
jgi:glutathione peroxidase